MGEPTKRGGGVVVGGGLSAEFYGSAQAIFFSIAREKHVVKAYKWTGQN